MADALVLKFIDGSISCLGQKAFKSSSKQKYDVHY